MNEKLQFSWGHIFAFLALIVVAYVSFVGFTYLTNGNFENAAIGMSVTLILYAIFFIGAQQLKASGRNMSRKIILERIFIFGSPIIFIGGMISMSHFWTVTSRNDEIVAVFTKSIEEAKQLFSDYESYSNQRIDAYEKTLNRIIINQTTDKKSFNNAGFNENREVDIQKKNMVETLQLKLLSQNYDDLKTVAVEWIDHANQGASTLNVFLLGNTQEIKSALNDWETQLKEFSAKELSNEAILAEVPQFNSDGAKSAIGGIESLTNLFTTQRFPTFAAIIFGIVIYLMLLFPYLLQDRHTKSVYRLIGNEQSQQTQKRSKHKQKESDELEYEEDTDYPIF